MKKYLAGYTEFNNTKEYFNTDDFKTFYSKNDKELEESDLEFWAEWINSPWSQAHEFYKISINCKDAYTEMNKNDPKFKCEYIIYNEAKLFEASIHLNLNDNKNMAELIKKKKENA